MSAPRGRDPLSTAGDRPQLKHNPLGEFMDPHEIDGRRVVMILILQDESGNVLDSGHAMRTGEAHWDGETLWLDWGENEPPYAVAADWFDRFKPVAPGLLADDTGAELYFMVGVSPMEEGGEKSGKYRPLGWRMPDPSPEDP
jgi:hypothetical protein